MTERTPEQAARIARRLAAMNPLGRLLRRPEWRAAHPEHEQTNIVVLPDDTVAYILDLLDLPPDPDSKVTDPDDRATFLAAIADDGTIRVFRLTEVTPPNVPHEAGGSRPEIAPPAGAFHPLSSQEASRP